MLALQTAIWQIRSVRDLPGQPVLDKNGLVGGCVRLPARLDLSRLVREVIGLPADDWEVRGGAHRYPSEGVHRAAETLFLRGYTPAEGDLPIEDRPPLDKLPYVRQLIEREIGTRPQRCLLARLPAGASIPLHIDRAPYFAKTLRVHIPVESHERVWMFCAGHAYVMKPGEAWALNNVAVHGVWNADPDRSRTHLICDFLPDTTLVDLLARGERGLGRPMPEAEAHFTELGRGQMIAGG